MNVPYAITENSLTVVIDCTPHVLASTHPNFDRVKELLARGASADDIRDLVNIPQAIVRFMQGNVEIRDRVVYYKGNELHNYLAGHILRFMEANDPALVKPLVAFLDNVMENPSYRAVQGLFEWAQKSNLPITSDGHLLAWKIVREDYRDIYTGRFDNSVGKIVEQPRNLCNEDPDQTCSHGLHFCSYDYLPHYGSRGGRKILIVKINPKDVVAFPRDYNTSKGRCCRYEVVGEVPEDNVPDFFKSRLVYDGFDVVTSDLMIEVGQRWRTRDGDVAVIESVSDHDDAVYSVLGHLEDAPENTLSWTVDGRYYFCFSDIDGLDLVELIPDVLPGDVEMAVGQVWETKDGDIVSVTSFSRKSPNYGHVFALSSGDYIWESNGDGMATTTPGRGLLKRLISE